MIIYKRGDRINFITKTYSGAKLIYSSDEFYFYAGVENEHPLIVIPSPTHFDGGSNDLNYKMHDAGNLLETLSLYMIEVDNNIKFAVLVAFDDTGISFKEFDSLVFANDFIKDYKDLV